MIIRHFIKVLNNTEIGKGNTNESYVLVSRGVKIDKIFDRTNYTPRFINLKNGNYIQSIHITTGNEFRINGLGDFYRINNVNAGDEIIFERTDDGNNTQFFINILNKKNIIVFQKNSKGFESLNLDRLQTKLTDNKYVTPIQYNGYSGILDIEFKELSFKEYSDSPARDEFLFY